MLLVSVIGARRRPPLTPARHPHTALTTLHRTALLPPPPHRGGRWHENQIN